MSKSRPALVAALTAATLCSPIMGCQPAMSTQAAAAVTKTESSLKFSKHNFSAVCYNASGCSVSYNNFKFVDSPEDRLAGPPPGPDYKRAWGGAMYGSIENFPPPAEVAWTSLDGERHKTTVDIGEIFRREQVLHDVPEERLAVATPAISGPPDIFLEINDRTITVYMKALIFLRDGSAGAPARDEALVAWKRVF